MFRKELFLALLFLVNVVGFCTPRAAHADTPGLTVDPVIAKRSELKKRAQDATTVAQELATGAISLEVTMLQRKDGAVARVQNEIDTKASPPVAAAVAEVHSALAGVVAYATDTTPWMEEYATEMHNFQDDIAKISSQVDSAKDLDALKALEDQLAVIEKQLNAWSTSEFSRVIAKAMGIAGPLATLDETIKKFYDVWGSVMIMFPMAPPTGTSMGF